MRRCEEAQWHEGAGAKATLFDIALKYQACNLQNDLKLDCINDHNEKAKSYNKD